MNNIKAEIKARILKRTILFFVIIIFIFSAYFLYQLKNFILGPKIIVKNLKEWSETKEDFFEINGKALNASNISLNGRKIFLSGNGDFKENLLLARGINYIKISAEDKFGHKMEKRYYVAY